MTKLKTNPKHLPWSMCQWSDHIVRPFPFGTPMNYWLDYRNRPMHRENYLKHQQQRHFVVESLVCVASIYLYADHSFRQSDDKPIHHVHHKHTAYYLVSQRQPSNAWMTSKQQHSMFGKSGPIWSNSWIWFEIRDSKSIRLQYHVKIVLTFPLYLNNSSRHDPRRHKVDLPARQHQDHADALSSVQVASMSLYSSPSNPPKRLKLYHKTFICKKIRLLQLTEFSVFRPSRPPQMISLFSNKATPNCIRRPVANVFNIDHLFNLGQKLSMLIDPRWVSIPLIANNLPTVDFLGRVRSDVIWARRSGIKWYLSASITSCWHSLEAHKFST